MASDQTKGIIWGLAAALGLTGALEWATGSHQNRYELYEATSHCEEIAENLNADIEDEDLGFPELECRIEPQVIFPVPVQDEYAKK